MLLLPQVYLAARLQLVRPWPEANGKEQSLVTNVRSLGCSENPQLRCSHLFSHGNLARATVVSSRKKRKVFVVAALQKSHVTSVRCEGPLYCRVLRNLSG